MAMGHFLQIQETEVDDCRLNLTHLSPSAAASGVVVAAVAAVPVVAEAFAFAEAFYKIINILKLPLRRLPLTHYDYYSAWLFGPCHLRPCSSHFAGFLTSGIGLTSYLVDVFVEAFAAAALVWNENFAD